MTTRPPIVCGGQWTRAVELAGHRCQCRGECGTNHPDPGRCPNSHGQQVHRYGPVRLAVVELDGPKAVCQPCHDGIRRRAAKDASTSVRQAETLF